jgi:serine/threonine protein kinase
MIKRVGQLDMLDWQHVLRFTMQLARALEFLHKHEVLHRHVFPANVLIDGHERQAKLGALMWARTPEGALPEPVLKAGQNRPELGFLAPERLRGGMGDGRADLYSLGVTAYTLLTGRPPFEGRTRDETIARIMESQPARPKEFQLALPESFQRVVLRMLAKRPEDRYQTASQLLADLDRIALNPSSEEMVVVPPAPAQATAPITVPPPEPSQAQSPAPPKPAPPAGNEGRIFLTCKCGQPLKVREQFAGAPVRCPFCGNLVVVPAKNSAGLSIMAPPPQLTPDAADQPLDQGGDLGEPPSSGVPKLVIYVVLAILFFTAVGGYFLLKKGPPEKPDDTQPSAKSTEQTGKPSERGR